MTITGRLAGGEKARQKVLLWIEGDLSTARLVNGLNPFKTDDDLIFSNGSYFNRMFYDEDAYYKIYRNEIFYNDLRADFIACHVARKWWSGDRSVLGFVKCNAAIGLRSSGRMNPVVNSVILKVTTKKPEDWFSDLYEFEYLPDCKDLRQYKTTFYHKAGGGLVVSASGRDYCDYFESDNVRVPKELVEKFKDANWKVELTPYEIECVQKRHEYLLKNAGKDKSDNAQELELENRTEARYTCSVSSGYAKETGRY